MQTSPIDYAEVDRDLIAVQLIEETGAERVRFYERRSGAIEGLTNAPRIVVEVECSSANGSTACGHHFKPGPNAVEVYATPSELRALLARVRTPEQDRMLAQAEAHCARLTEEWARDPSVAKQLAGIRARLGENAAAEYTRLHCNLRWPHSWAVLFGRSTPTPGTLHNARVVHPTERDAGGERKRIALHAFVELSPADRAPWLLAPYETPASRADRANEHLAATIARALEGKRK